MGGIIPESLPSSKLNGFNVETRRMEVSLYHYYYFGGEYLGVAIVKSSEDNLTMYWDNQVFIKSK